MHTHTHIQLTPSIAHSVSCLVTHSLTHALVRARARSHFRPRARSRAKQAHPHPRQRCRVRSHGTAGNVRAPFDTRTMHRILRIPICIRTSMPALPKPTPMSRAAARGRCARCMRPRPRCARQWARKPLCAIGSAHSDADPRRWYSPCAPPRSACGPVHAFVRACAAGGHCGVRSLLALCDIAIGGHALHCTHVCIHPRLRARSAPAWRRVPA